VSRDARSQEDAAKQRVRLLVGPADVGFRATPSRAAAWFLRDGDLDVSHVGPLRP
jgi:hypothetical protein